MAEAAPYLRTDGQIRNGKVDAESPFCVPGRRWVVAAHVEEPQLTELKEWIEGILQRVPGGIEFEGLCMKRRVIVGVRDGQVEVRSANSESERGQHACSNIALLDRPEPPGYPGETR